MGQYHVFYKRDLVFEKRKNYGGKMLFDLSKSFDDEEKAYDFAYNNVPALMIKKISGRQDKSKSEGTTYIVAAKFVGKYEHHDYGGGREALTNFDVLRCNNVTLAKIIEDFAQEGAKEILIGIEQKLF